MCSKPQNSKMTSFTCEIPIYLKKRLFEMAEEDHRTASSLARHLIAIEADRRDKPQQKAAQN